MLKWFDQELVRRTGTALTLMSVVIILAAISPNLAHDVLLLLLLCGACVESFNLLGQTLLQDLFNPVHWSISTIIFIT